MYSASLNFLIEEGKSCYFLYKAKTTPGEIAEQLKLDDLCEDESREKDNEVYYKKTNPFKMILPLYLLKAKGEYERKYESEREKGKSLTQESRTNYEATLQQCRALRKEKKRQEELLNFLISILENERIVNMY